MSVIASTRAGVLAAPSTSHRVEAREEAQTPGNLRLHLHKTLESAEPIWRGLACSGVRTPYQDYDWARAWLDHVGLGVEPRLVVASTADGRPMALLPLVRRRRGLLQVGEWLGGKHANFNMGVFDESVAWPPEAAQALLERAGRLIEVDVLVLLNQPEVWAGARNPLSTTSRSVSASTAWSLVMEGDYAQVIGATRGRSFQKRLRWLERQLAKSGPLRFGRVIEPAETQRVIELFLAQKTERFARLGKANDFDGQGAAGFARALADLASDASGSVEIFALWAGDEMVAMMCGGVAHGRYSCFFNSITTGDLARFSPSQVLIARVLEDLCARGFVGFDLGVGDSPYKAMWCQREALFDCFVGVTLAGRAASRVLRLGYGLKRHAKNNERLHRLLDRARARLGGKQQGGGQVSPDAAS